ncbi:hypothetical protein GCM10009715_12310 [Paeniglutamicibacter psychrophenolicus]|uniref:MFS transporter n=1 Tax=Paeniglutamicibacter psychrophenolicus TaxID=257454 RepID=A0ABS4W7L1_9MICC|nr:hypothetical protein [Paeniglutamicibacter psychrophenolicus]MBP2372180.1 hypothetical protein [Paeniglutamicibacter psychrophenolicus]
MSNSNTRTSAGSKKTPNAAPERPAKAPAPGKDPAASGTTPVKSPTAPEAEAPKSTEPTPPGPTDLVRAAEDSAPVAGTDRVSERIAHPVPHHIVPEPGSVDEVLKSPEAPAAEESPLRHLTDKHAAKAADEQPVRTVSGGFSGINNWLDSMPEPDWERLGDKIYAAPTTFKARWQQRRVERAKAAELKEQNRLLEVARAEAKAEAAKREAVRLAHQAKLDAAAHRAAEARIVAQAQAEARTRAAEAARNKPMDPPPVVLSAPVVPEVDQSPEAEVAIAGEGTPVAWVPTPQVDPEQLAALVASAKAAIDHQQATAEPVYVAPYALPEFEPNPAEKPTDLRRRIAGSAAALAAAALSLATLDTLSSGRVESLGSNYSMLSLAPTAHLVWPVIFIWALLGAAYSWAPSQRSAVRQRVVGYPFALACAASGLWMLSALNDWLFPALVCAAASCWFLFTAMRGLNDKTARTRRERMLTDAPVSLMTGFSLVVLASTFTSMLASWGAGGGVGIWIATLLVPAAGYAAMALSMTERGRIILAIGFGWGMFWVLVPRVLGTSNSIWVAILAGMAGFVVLLATENRRYQIHHAEHRAARGKSTDFS